MTARIAGIVMALALSLTGCTRGGEERSTPSSTTDPTASSAASTAMPTTTVATATTSALASNTSVRTLEPPEAESPAAGVCPRETGAILTVDMHPDVPSPRCAQVAGDQRLEVRNKSGRQAVVRLASFEKRLDNGEGHTFHKRFGDFLAPGVHDIEMSVYGGGSGAELWLREGA